MTDDERGEHGACRDADGDSGADDGWGFSTLDVEVIAVSQAEAAGKATAAVVGFHGGRKFSLTLMENRGRKWMYRSVSWDVDSADANGDRDG